MAVACEADDERETVPPVAAAGRALPGTKPKPATRQAVLIRPEKPAQVPVQQPITAST
jgi:hypothetical protein